MCVCVCACVYVCACVCASSDRSREAVTVFLTRGTAPQSRVTLPSRLIQASNHGPLSFYDEVEQRDDVKREIDDVAGGWSEGERDEALAETKKSFEWQGKIVGILMGGKGGH